MSRCLQKPSLKYIEAVKLIFMKHIHTCKDSNTSDKLCLINTLNTKVHMNYN
jgi:hypothetical protein